MRLPLVCGLVVFVLVGFLFAVNDARVFASDGGNPELAHVLPEIEEIVAATGVVIARKRHIPYSAGAQFSLLPSAESAQDLRNELEAVSSDAGDGEQVYLLYGEVERHIRPQIAAMIAVEDGIDWLAPVKEGDQPQPWALYRFAPGSR